MQTRLTHPLAALIQSCVRGYTLSLLLAFWTDLDHSKLIPKGSGTPVPDLVASLRPCCGKTWQSKRLSSILIVQSRISGNLLSCLLISNSQEWGAALPTQNIHTNHIYSLLTHMHGLSISIWGCWWRPPAALDLVAGGMGQVALF